jgi:DNA topoisomerase-1
VLKDLVAEAKKSESVLLASDPDREGEAIAYLIGKHLEEKIPGLPVKRVAFNEITQAAVKDAVKRPGPSISPRWMPRKPAACWTGS